MWLIACAIRDRSIFNHKAKIWWSIYWWFASFVQIANMKLFWFADLAEKFQVYNSYTTHKFTKSKSSNFGLIEEIMDLSDIAFIRINSQISHENAKWIYMLTQICFHPVVSMPSENSTIFLIVAYIFCLLPQFILIYSLKAIILFFFLCVMD